MEAQEHEHCEECFRLYCNVAGVCKMVLCEFGCRFRMHECKVEDHKVVCPKLKVPCSNVAYGCPATMPRENIKIHLASCPASAIFCTMEWNRYPVYSKSRLNWVPFFQPNPVPVKGQLDVELALRDQRILGDVFKKRCRKGRAKVDVLRVHNKRLSNSHENGFERTKQPDREVEMVLSLSKLENKLRQRRYENIEGTSSDDRDTEIPVFKSKIERAGGHALTTCEIQRNQSESEIFQPQVSSCRDATLSSTEDKENSKPPGTQLEAEGKQSGGFSWHNARSENTRDAHGELAHHEKSVPPLLAPEGDIKESLNEIATQMSDSDLNINTNNFPSDASEISSLPPPPEFVPIHLAESLGLNVMLETLPKFQKQIPLYSIPCNQIFRRDEYGDHFRNVHSEIHGGLNGWLEQRCPLAQYGCTYVRYRLHPNTQCGQVVFNQDLGNFGIRPCMERKCRERQAVCPHREAEHPSTDLLCLLPIEILETIAGLLDGFSLCNLSRTCKLLREVCRRLVVKKGIVLFEWEKRIYDTGEWSWQVRKRKWFFSTSFTPVHSWVHTETPSMSAHLEQCRFYQRNINHKQFRYHSTKLPPHMEGLDSSWSGPDADDNVLPSYFIRKTKKLNRATFEQGIRELEEIAAGRGLGANAHPIGDHLEFVIQCNENYEMGENDFVVAEPEAPDAVKLAVQCSASHYEGEATTCWDSNSQGACASASPLTSDQKFDPCQTAAEIARAYMYMYAGAPSDSPPGLDTDDDSSCDDDFNDDGLPLVYVPSSTEKEKSTHWSDECDSDKGPLLCATDPLLENIPDRSQPDTENALKSAPSGKSPPLGDDSWSSRGRVSPDRAAEVVANAYMYLYTGSLTNSALHSDVASAGISHGADENSVGVASSSESGVEIMAGEIQESTRSLRVEVSVCDVAPLESLEDEQEPDTTGLMDHALHDLQVSSGQPYKHDQRIKGHNSEQGEEFPDSNGTKLSVDLRSLGFEKSLDETRDTTDHEAFDVEESHEQSRDTADQKASNVEESHEQRRDTADQKASNVEESPEQSRDTADQKASNVEVSHEQSRDTADKGTEEDSSTIPDVAVAGGVSVEEARPLSCSAESDTSSEETSETTASMYISSSGEGPSFVSVENVEHDDLDGGALGCHGDRVAMEIHVDVDHS